MVLRTTCVIILQALQYGTVDIVPALTTYLVTKVPGWQVTPSNYNLINVYAKILRFLLSPQWLTDETQKDRFHATPFWHKCNQVIPQHFDTALVHDALEAEDIGLKGESRFKPQYATKLMHPQGYRVTYVWVIFRFPDWFHCDHTLAYIEWFRRIEEPKEPLCMSPVSYATWEGNCHVAIVSIHSILWSCHLTLKFSCQRNVTWTAENILNKCSDFFLDSHSSIYMFQMCNGDFVLEDNTWSVVIKQCMTGLKRMAPYLIIHVTYIMAFVSDPAM